ncbi:Type III restriction enzyme, res subunit [Crateriforma conspicua]|uniref:Type III restriction enzyme, res subunit n=1 Tax=Crateriforma conspicua TaxID=2527996 RepID=A0A5C6FV81_9PLAN|nr:DEAD/DEAH box helicase family protein [Crateriforma conspicua]TWU65505.1 Type III restriction enzyme, res subunit [Crateriforma conspicua]
MTDNDQDRFYKEPILNSPYEYPNRHWELDKTGQPTQKVVHKRRAASFITPIPKPKKRREKKGKASARQREWVFEDDEGLSTQKQQYDPNPIINELRYEIDKWRQIDDPGKWNVTPETARLLQHWRGDHFSSIRPFFCQVEAVEVAIWLTEVAPNLDNKVANRFLDTLFSANEAANPGLSRLACKLATGAGKTTVMAMLIAWQTINWVRRKTSSRFTRGFLIIAPGLTIKDRLRVLQPNDPDSYYKSRELVPGDMLPDLEQARIVITNYHAFKLRNTLELSSGGRALLQGRGPELQTTETEGQMIKRVMPELMGMRNIMVINDEAHHCYREKPPEESEEADPKGKEEKDEAKENSEAARLWISGIEAVDRTMGVSRVMDLSATPFFLRGSGYAEGTLFPWTMSDFSLMDAIECGIVKLPRVPIADNLPGGEMPMYRNLWEHIRSDMPKSGRSKASDLDPGKIPTPLETALDALYGHYKKTFELWQEGGIDVPPCFIVVCNNTSSSKLVYDYISGYERQNEDGTSQTIAGRLPLFRNFDPDNHEPYPEPRTLLIDSGQLESGEGLHKDFRQFNSEAIEQFRKEIVQRTGDRQKADNISDEEILREVMNTVGKKGRLGESIRCVVSVSMLTEGWDANTVTHVLGVRGFTTQLLCEQVIGRALRRQSYDLNADGKFDVEYADVLGIPFDFNAKPVVAPPQKPRETVQVKAVRPERDSLEIRFPRVSGYRVELPNQKIQANFNDDHRMLITPQMVGATETKNSGIIGEQNDLTLKHLEDMRRSTLLFHLTQRLIEVEWREPGESPRMDLFGQLKRIANVWLKDYVECKGGTYPAQLMYQALADQACKKISSAIVTAHQDEKKIKAMLDAYNPSGSTRFVNFNTSKADRWQTSVDRCHVNWVVLDSDWEAEFCRIVEKHPAVRAYVKNHGLGLEVPYRYMGQAHKYRPDFIVQIDDDRGTLPDGTPDLLNLVVEIKGYRGEHDREKANTMKTYWIPGVNNLGTYGRWAFAEFTEVFQMEADFEEKIAGRFDEMIDDVIRTKSSSVTENE